MGYRFIDSNGDEHRGSRPEPTTKAPTKRPEMTYDVKQYENNKLKLNTTQSFDQIIMECQDMLSVETEVKKAYDKWLGVRVKKRGRLSVYSKVPSVPNWLKLFIPFSTICSAFFYFSMISNAIWSMPVACFSGVFGTVFWAISLANASQLRFNYIKGSKAPKKQPTEHNKFQFLKESYVGTIQKLDDRLNIIKQKINTQIDAHTQDKEQVLQYQDMFDETDSVVHKIERAISSLRESHDKVSEKKAELNKTLTEYIGENGYISQKEQELERIKVAQELSDRMQTNFGKTMEIVKNVDVLTDAIIPGIKQLMEFRIPELIEKVEFECDRERVMLEVRS